MEVAEIEGNKEAIQMLKEKFAQQKATNAGSGQPGFDRQPFDQMSFQFKQAGLDGAIHSLSSASNQLLDAKQVEQHMKTGAIPCGIWHSFSQRLQSMQTELQQLIEEFQQQLKNVADNSPNENAQEVEKLKNLFKQEKQFVQCRRSVEVLEKCETQCVQSFYAKFGLEKVGGDVHWDDVGLFLNLIGLSQHVERIQKLECTPERAMKLLSEDSEALQLSLRDKLTLKFANHMIKSRGQLPFVQHFADCKICRQAPHVFLKEYFPAACENKEKLETFQLMMISSLKESAEAFGTLDPEPMLRSKAVLELHSKMNTK